MKTAFSAFLLILLITACSRPAPVPVVQTQGVIGNQAVLAEASRVAALVDKKQAKPEDLDRLAELVKDDESASDEMHEITTMVKYGEFVHAGHGLGFIFNYLRTGKEAICPAHELSHYYVFMKHNETEMAKDALKGAQEKLDAWIPKAREYDATYHPTPSFNDTLERFTADMAAITAGNSNASNDEVMFLSDALCVEED